ncbi:ShlB/FhaC/HecB family hemolysin secretion/activation protein [Roseateles sp. LYH14W]|uniref:ShlB/FhaC/HecB family hemolysin secretion/activation protein n=1 Tax=Pelomonas parva TaxID=3299032 RepID=A0ABW7F412_9BURK
MAGGLGSWLAAVGLAAALLGPAAALAQSPPPRLHATLMLRGGHLALDPASTRLALGDHAAVYRACQLSDDALKAGLIAAIDKTLQRRGPVLEQLALDPFNATDADNQPRTDLPALRLALGRLAKSDPATAEANTFSGPWTQAQQVFTRWLEAHRNDPLPVRVTFERGLYADVYATMASASDWLDEPARPIPDLYGTLQTEDHQALERGAVIFDIAPPFQAREDGTGKSKLALTVNLAAWASRLQALREDLLDPLHCQLWSRQAVVGRAQDYMQARGVALQHYATQAMASKGQAANLPQMEPNDQAGIAVEPTRYRNEPGSVEVVGGRVLLSPDPQLDYLIVHADPDLDGPLVRRVLYLLLPTPDWGSLRDALATRMCIARRLPGGKPGPGTQPLMLSFVDPAFPTQFSSTYLTQRALAERMRRLADVGYRLQLASPILRAEHRRKSVSLVVTKSGSASAGMPVGALGLTDCAGGSAPEAGAVADIAAVAAPPPRAAQDNGRREPPRHELAVGAQYDGAHPLRLLSTLARAGLSPDDTLSLSAAFQGKASADLQYSRDFLWFDNGVARRVQASVRSYTEFEPGQPRSSGEQDERHTGLDLSATVDLWRDVENSFAQLLLTAGRKTIRPEAGAPTGTAGVTLRSAGLGLVFSHSLHATARPSALDAELQVQAGRAGAGHGRYGRAQASLAWQRFVGPFWRWDLRANATAVRGPAPQAEWPTFGGEQSVRGYAADLAVARRTWALQNELWLPPPGADRVDAALGALLRRQVALALFVDIGGLRGSPSQHAGTKAGAGLGLRYLADASVTLRLDWARPVGEDDARLRSGQWLLSITSRHTL